MKIARKVLLAASFVLMVLLLGCGGGSSASQNAPVISNLSYAPNQATQGSGSGTVTIYGTVDAVDIDGNMSTITFTSYDSIGNAIHTSTDPISSGYFSDRFGDPSLPGLIAFTAGMDTTVAGNYTFKIYITDSTGSQSNILTGTLGVI